MKSIEETVAEIDEMTASAEDLLSRLRASGAGESPSAWQLRGGLDALCGLKEWILKGGGNGKTQRIRRHETT